jgi:hypothetical protein
MKKSKTTNPPGTDVFYRHREEYQKYLHLTESVQRELLADVEELGSQEGWGDEISEGVKDWLNDTDAIWRLLRVSFKVQYNDMPENWTDLIATPV